MLCIAHVLTGELKPVLFLAVNNCLQNDLLCVTLHPDHSLKTFTHSLTAGVRHVRGVRPNSGADFRAPSFLKERYLTYFLPRYKYIMETFY